MSVILRAETEQKEPLTAVFFPDKGMTFTSYKKGDLEIIDQSTKPLFEKRFAGLGPIIGPHFHHRNPSVIPKVKNPSLFPHLAHVTGEEPFSHGVARYAPWHVDELNESRIVAHLLGDDLWHGVALKELEGQNFKMSYSAELTKEGLKIELSVVSDTDSVVGLHTYYALAKGEGAVSARVKNEYNDKISFKPLKAHWPYDENHKVTLSIVEDFDFGFFPFPDPLHTEIELITPTHGVKVRYHCDNQENSWQLWHPKGASFVCIEPLSAKDPQKPHLTASSIKIEISII